MSAPFRLRLLRGGRDRDADALGLDTGVAEHMLDRVRPLGFEEVKCGLLPWDEE
jgi:hypothetical protein